MYDSSEWKQVYELVEQRKPTKCQSKREQVYELVGQRKPTKYQLIYTTSDESQKTRALYDLIYLT